MAGGRKGGIGGVDFIAADTACLMLYAISTAGLLTRVDCRPPTVEVRCQNVHVEADVFADHTRNLPSIINAYRDVIEVC